MKLSKTSSADLSRNKKTTFVLKERPVGLLRYVQLYNEGKTAETNWFISYIVLSTPYNNKCYTLPCCRWLFNRSILSLRDGTGELLPDVTCSRLRLAAELIDFFILVIAIAASYCLLVVEFCLTLKNSNNNNN